MNKQTENYIVLKPIAERFNEVAKNISDEEIKSIIKDAMREQIKDIFNFEELSVLTEEYIEDHTDDIKEAIGSSIFNRLKGR